jgi:hypothetical protein
MPSQATQFQRDFIRSLYKAHGGDEAATCSAYAKAEVQGRVFRKTGDLRMPSELYAAALLRDGLAKGWIKPPSLGVLDT